MGGLKLIIVAFLVFFCSSGPSFAQEIVVVKGPFIKPYEEAVKGFRSVCRAELTELESVLSKSELLSRIYQIKPDLVLAIGNTALQKIKDVRGIPVVYAMVTNPGGILNDAGHVSGVSMNIPLEKQLKEFLNISPSSRNIGIVYDPDKSSHFLEEAHGAAQALGVEIISREVDNPRDVISAINSMKGVVDAFLMLPDTTVVTEESLEYLFLTSHEKHIPVIAFSEKYLKSGAFMAVSIDAADIGRQAGLIASRVLKGISISQIPPGRPRTASISINIKTARRFEH
jgi:putative ABC transport system substrate-binding protein